MPARPCAVFVCKKMPSPTWLSGSIGADICWGGAIKFNFIVVGVATAGDAVVVEVVTFGARSLKMLVSLLILYLSIGCQH